MKHYTFNGVTTNKLPGILHLPDGNQISPVSEASFVEYGGTIEEDDDPTPFEEACSQFRQVCAAIGQFIGDANFRGGFDEYTAFASSQAFQNNPVLGNTLAIQWSGCNERCKYEGAKEGYQQPQWWYKCWEMAETENKSEE